jgi:hypothetical protein
MRRLLLRVQSGCAIHLEITALRLLTRFLLVGMLSSLGLVLSMLAASR